jgi:hypothetical protein
VPLVAVAVSLFLKFVTRKDDHRAFLKEDLAVGLNLAVTALLIFLTNGAQIAKQILKTPNDSKLIEKTAMIPWILFVYLLGIWAISTTIRKLGWESDGKLKVFWGIVVPDAYGLVCLIFAVNWID